MFPPTPIVSTTAPTPLYSTGLSQYAGITSSSASASSHRHNQETLISYSNGLASLSLRQGRFLPGARLLAASLSKTIRFGEARPPPMTRSPPDANGVIYTSEGHRPGFAVSHTL